MGEKTKETNNMQLLQDTFIIEQLQVINEGKSDGPMKIRGVFGRCNEKNNNGRIYPTSVLESQLEIVKPLILERRLCGELDHPQNDTVKLSNASHLVTKLEMKGNDLIGEAEILKTPAGLTAKALVEGGVKIGISSRGMGTLSEDHNGDKIVNEDFRLVTFDLVADPSTRGAFPGLSESTESKFVRESQSKLTKESNFVTMLESRMRGAYQPWIEEAKAKKKKAKKNLPGNQEAIDADGDGKIEKSDFAKLRGKEDSFQCEAFKLVKADGIWHRFAGAILGEAFADELDKEDKRTLGKGSADTTDTGSMMGNFRARSHAKGMEVAAAKGRTKGKDIEQKGQIRRGRRMEKAKSAAAAGGPVTGGEKVADAAKRAGGAVVSGAKKTVKAVAGAPGKVIDKAVAVSDASSKAKIVSQRGRVQRENARKNNAAAKKASGPGNKPKPEAPAGKPEAPAGKPEAPAGKPEAAAPRGGAPRQQSKAQKREAEIAARSSAGKPEAPSSGKNPSAPVSKSGTNINPDLQRRQNRIQSKRGSSRQSLATTRDRMIKKGDLKRTGEGGDISASRAYKQIGLMLAEMFDLI